MILFTLIFVVCLIIYFSKKHLSDSVYGANNHHKKLNLIAKEEQKFIDKSNDENRNLIQKIIIDDIDSINKIGENILREISNNNDL